MRLNKTAAKKEIRTGRLVCVATSSSLCRCGSSRPFPQLLLEAAPLRRSSGTNVACAPLLVLRGSSSPSFPATEATFGSDRVVQRHLAGLSCDNQALLLPFGTRTSRFPCPGGLLAASEETTVRSRPSDFRCPPCGGHLSTPRFAARRPHSVEVSWRAFARQRLGSHF